jgi:hypothetical protein
MYNLAKLLSDEPKKLERLFVLFLKLLITLYLTGLLLDYKFTINALVEKPIPEGLTTSKLILFFVATIIVWFAFWNFLLDMIMCEFIVWLLSLIPNKRKLTFSFLEILNVATVKDGRLISPKKNMVDFAEGLHQLKDTQEFHDIKSRQKSYYVVALGAYIVLLLSHSLSTKWIGWGAAISINLLLGAVVYNVVHSFIVDNYDSLLKEFDSFAFIQKVFAAVSNHEEIKSCYEVTLFKSRVRLQRKQDYSWVPEEVIIETYYHWSKDLGKLFLDFQAQRIESKSIVEPGKYLFVVSNIEISPALRKIVEKQDRMFYIIGQNQDEIITGIETAYHIMRNSYKEPSDPLVDQENQTLQ